MEMSKEVRLMVWKEAMPDYGIYQAILTYTDEQGNESPPKARSTWLRWKPTGPLLLLWRCHQEVHVPQRSRHASELPDLFSTPATRLVSRSTVRCVGVLLSFERKIGTKAGVVENDI